MYRSTHSYNSFTISKFTNVYVYTFVQLVYNINIYRCIDSHIRTTRLQYQHLQVYMFAHSYNLFTMLTLQMYKFTY